jgi:uncharacterized protein (UPF0332 family)
VIGRDFLTVAQALSAGPTEAAWRSAISRAYYAAFHTAREFVTRLGFRVPAGEQAHAYLWLRLSNTGDPAADVIGRLLRDLRGRRNTADYELGRPRSQANATDAANDARDLVARMDALAGTPAETVIRDGMRAYERTVLKVDTWGP